MDESVINGNKVIYRTHAIERMFQRSIDQHEVYQVIKDGEIVDEYPDDQPYPSRLILGWVNDRPIHVVVAENEEGERLIVITVYEPDTDTWEDDFKRRK